MKLLVPGLLVAVAALPVDVPAQAPTFSTKVVSVRVDALVVDEAGHPIEGLTAADFEVLDDGVPQSVDLIASGQVPLNVVLALDMSESVAGDRLTELRAAAQGVVAGLRVDDQAALVTFSEVVERGTALTKDLDRVCDALNRARGVGNTGLFDATYTALLLGQADIGRTLLILFSDGVDTSSWLSPEWVLQAARRSNAVVYSTTIAGANHLSFLTDLGRLTGGSSYPVESTRDLQATFARILEEFRHRYLLSYTPRDVPEGGWHQLQVRVKGRHAVVRAREGYGG